MMKEGQYKDKKYESLKLPQTIIWLALTNFY